MPTIVGAASALPEHVYSQAELRQATASLFAERLPDLEETLRIFDHSRIERRQLMRPLDWYARPRTTVERSRIYLDEGGALAREAARRCLARADVAPREIDRVLWVSSTGIAAPTPDAYLINELGLRPSTIRVPIWGLGCAGGAAGLGRAFEFCRAFPESLTLVVALETCSLTLVDADATKRNVVAASLFADGAAAALVAGDATGRTGAEILRTRSHLFPDSYQVMGWNVVDEGLGLVLSPKLPAILKRELPALAAELRREAKLERFQFYLTHPGGARVIDAYQQALQLTDEDLALTAEVLRDHGNVSSVSVLLVLERWLAGQGIHGGQGLLSAFGPGFSAELLLVSDVR